MPLQSVRLFTPCCPENVGSRFLSLLQSAPDQTLSAIFGTAKKPNCRRHSRVRLGGSRAERYGKLLSECRFVSEAWGLADLLYKLFSLTFQCPSLIAQPEGWYPFAPILARSKVRTFRREPQAARPARPRPTRARHTPGVWGIILPMAMPSPATQPDREVLAGIVERVTFHNAETGFCVLRVKARGHRDLATIVGHAATISAGEWITASGDWVNDRTHGQQFKARFMRTSAPSSVEGIEKYLASGMIRGIGPVYARKMVKAFGEKVFDIIEAEPDRLREVDGIGPVRAQRITAAWAEQKIVREIMVFLHSHGVGTARAVRIYKTYGADAVQVMTENPYRLARDIRGIGFKTADAIAIRLGIEKTAMIRVRAGISYALTEAMDEGHCGLPTEELVPLAAELLEVPKELVADRAGTRTGRGDGDRRHG